MPHGMQESAERNVPMISSACTKEDATYGLGTYLSSISLGQ